MKIKKNFVLCILLAIASNVSASQIINSVNITTNLVFYLKAAWKTNGPESEFKSDDLIYYGLLGTSTNEIYYRHFPSGNFDFHLFDQQGKEIPKTQAGLNLTATPQTPTLDDLVNTRKFGGYFVDNKGGEYRHLFRPDEMFVMTNSGAYELEIRMNLCVIMTNGLPDLKAMIDARNVTGHGFPFIKNFGVLSSPPLRVKIINKAVGPLHTP